MPPRAAKKGSGGPGTKKTAARLAKTAAPAAAKVEDPAPAAAKVEDPAPAAEAAAPAEVAAEKVEEVAKVETSAAVEEVKVVEVVEEEKPVEPEAKSKDEEEPKEVYEEDKGERLELEDEPEYEPEDDTAVDYDEKGVANVGQEEGIEGEEDGEGEVGEEEEEGDVVDEDAEGEDEDDNAEDQQADAEEEDHHEVVKERRKRKEFEVFIGGLDKDATEDDVKKVFEGIGEITEVRLMKNPLTKKNKGFAFLRFATVEQAKRAVTEIKNPIVNGKQCGVAPSQDSDTLFLGNICKTWTKEQLKEKLKKYGVENIEDLTLVEDTNNEGMNRGFCFLEFSSRTEAMDAFKRLSRRDVTFGVDRSAKVAFADSFIEPDDEIMAQVKTVFIDGLPAAWDEDRVKESTKEFGEVEKVELARNMPAAKRKDFGFVTFNTHEAAVACAEGINNSELGDADHKVKVRARLSRPLQRGRGKHAQGDFRTGRGAPRGGRSSWSRPALPPPRFPARGSRPFGARGLPPISGRVAKRPIGFREGIRDRRPVMSVSDRARRPPPPDRFYDRRPPVPAYSKGSSKRDYRRDDFPAPRSRAASDYATRVPAERRPSYRDDYSSRDIGYADVPPRAASRNVERRPYPDEGYGRKVERAPPTYREGRSRDYDSVPGSKRPYSAMDDPPRYADVGSRHSRARVEYGVSGGSSQYDDAYDERIGRSHTGYGGGRSSLSGQDSHGLYSSRQGMGYGGGSVSGGDAGLYSSSISSSYLSRGSDVGGSSYSSLYSGRNLGSSGYLGGSGSGSYY